MSKQSFPVDYSEQIRAIALLRKGLATVAHYEKFGKRAVDGIAKIVGPSFQVWERKDPYFTGLHIRPVGLKAGEGWSISWTNSALHDNRPHWSARMAEELDRYDPTDAADRQIDEAVLVPRVAAIEAQILALQAEARAMFETLPIPRSAAVRAGRHFWKEASSALQSVYPATFGRQGER